VVTTVAHTQSCVSCGLVRSCYIELSMANKASRFWKWLTLGLFLAMISTGMSWFSLWNYYVSSRPREIQVTQGRVIPLSSHGIVVYLTMEERNRLAFLNHAGEVLAAGFLLVYFLKKPFANPWARS